MLENVKLNIPSFDFLKSPASITLNYAKSLFTWKGRDLTVLKDENFLSRNNWEHNLELLSEITVISPSASLMTKEIYQWLPINSPIAEGYSSVKEKFERLSAESYGKWLKIGSAIGITFLFIKAMEYNFNCLDQYEIVTEESVRECRIRFGDYLNQPGRIAQVALAVGAWVFAGWLIQNFGDFGLRGFVTQYTLNQDLATIYKITADSAREAFWSAVDKGDEKSADKIYKQALKIKALSPYLKTRISSELNIEDTLYKKMMHPLDLFIEDVQAYEKHKTTLTESTPPPKEKKSSQFEIDPEEHNSIHIQG